MRFLERPHPAVIATVRQDGSPVTAATWFAVVDGRIMLSMNTAGARVGRIRSNPNVALTVLADEWYSQLSISGHAIEIRDDPLLADVDALSMHYDGEPYDVRDQPTTTVIVEIDRWYAYGDPGGSADPKS
jgi:PPOX class probable F420-dependent enzyme